MRSFSMRFVTKFRSVARRWAGLRPSLWPDLRCLMDRSAVRFLRSDRRGFLRSWRSSLARKRRPDHASVLIEFHAEAQAHFLQNVLDLVERFAAKVFCLEHFRFGLLHQLAQVLNIGVLQTIVGANGKLELLHGTVQIFESWIRV